MSVLNMISQALRLDGWQNALTGLGTSRDKQTAMVVTKGRRLADHELVNLYEEDDLAARIVDALPEEALRQGFRLTLAANDAAESEEERENLTDDIRQLAVREKLLEARVWGRLFGGAAIFVAADDEQDPKMPLAEDRIATIRGLFVYDRRELSPMRRIVDPNNPQLGEVETYMLSPVSGQAIEIHASRLILFGGARTDRFSRVERDGWDNSVLQRPIEVLRAAAANWMGASHLMTDASQAVYKIKDLVSMFRTGNTSAVKTRMETVEMSRSLLRAILLDADAEDFERKVTSFTGMPEMLDRTWIRVAAAARMPVTILMGQSPAGLNATGESDHRMWENQIQAEQEHYLRPRAERLVRLLLLAKDGPTGGQEPDDWKLEFPALRQLTDTEKATLRKTAAEEAAIYIRDGVWLPEEVALARSGPAWSLDVNIDRDIRRKLLEADKAAMLNSPPPPQLPPTQPIEDAEGVEREEA